MHILTAALVIAGVLFAIRSAVRGFRDGARIERDPARALAILRGFRRAVVGLAVAGVGASFVWNVPALLGLSLAIMGEELLESTVMIRALKDAFR